MKKNILKIIIAVVVLGLLIGGIVLLKMPANTDSTPASTASSEATEMPVYTIYNTAEENVKNVLVVSGDFSMESQKLSDGSWTVNNLPESDIDTSKTKTFVDTAIDMKAESLIEENPSDLAQYGLDAPQTTVFINKNDGTSDKIFIGAKSAVNNDYFVMTSLGTEVYTLSFYKVDILKNPITYYTDFTRFEIEDTSEISAVKIERSDMTINFVKNTYTSQSIYSEWILTSPINTDANADYISNNVLKNIGNIKLSSPVEGSDFGFDKPTAKLTITIKPYDEEKEEYGEEYAEELIVGKLSEGDVYVKYKDKAYTVSASYLDFVNTPLINAVTKIQSLINIADVEKVDVNYRGTAHSLGITHFGEDNKDMAFTLDGTNMDESAAKKLYQELIGIQVDGIYNGQQTGEAIMSVYYKGYNGASDMNVEFRTINDLDCAFVKNGEIQFTVKKSVVTALMDTIDSYVNK